jgi:prepilin-type processing-associated H-X9-DG protein
MLINHQLYPYGAFLGPYLKSPRPFKCPADKSVVPLGPSGQRIPRVRSVSMNNRIGEGARSWSSPSAYLMYSTLSGISKPAPAQLLVLLDELPESLNDGCFFTDPDAVWQIMDFPATGHNGGAGFAFADGHSEVHRWKDSRTMPLIAQGGITPGNVASPGNVDLQWLHEHAAARR